MKLHFVGTGGGRFVTASQKRKTGGIILEGKESSIYIDPGPGALVHSREYNTEKLKGLIVSHSHLDHYSDAEPIIEKITDFHKNNCTLAGPESVLNGYGDIEKTVSSYHQKTCNNVINLTEENGEIQEFEIEAQEMFHTEPKTVGLKITEQDKTVGFWTDTEYSDELTKFYKDCDIIVIYCLRPKNSKVRGHTQLNKVPQILETCEASTAIITHFGSRFLESDMKEQKDWLKSKVDQKIIFAEDGMTFPGDRKLGSF